MYTESRSHTRITRRMPVEDCDTDAQGTWNVDYWAAFYVPADLSALGRACH